MSFDQPGSLPPLYVEIQSDHQDKSLGAQCDAPTTMPEAEWTSSLDVNAATRTIDTWSEGGCGVGAGGIVAVATTADSSSIGGNQRDDDDEPMDDEAVCDTTDANVTKETNAEPMSSSTNVEIVNKSYDVVVMNVVADEAQQCMFKLFILFEHLFVSDVNASVDRRMTVNDFKQWLADYLLLDVAQFSLSKIYTNAEYDVNYGDSSRMDFFIGANAVRFSP